MAKYASAFMTSMAPKRDAKKWSELVYVDLLCGPGRGIDRDTGAEFDGSPLAALRVRPPFDRLFFSDLRKGQVDALRKRVSEADSRRVTFDVGDCNVIAGRIAGQLTGGSLALAFIDPEGFEVTFKVFQLLAARRVDILFFFPSGIGIRRNLERFVHRPTSPMDAYGVAENGENCLQRNLLPAVASPRMKPSVSTSLGCSPFAKR